MNWSVKHHINWVDEHKFGISHFGMHPNILRHVNTGIRFDVFHLRCAITRRLIGNLQGFILGTTPDLIDQFTSILSDIWSTYNVLLFNMNKSFQSFKVDELLDFIRNTKKITDWLKKSFVETINLQ